MPASSPNEADLNLNLALAVVASSHGPVLLLDEARVVIAASAAFCLAFDIAPGAATNKTFAELGAGEWNIPQLQSLLKATAAGFAEVHNYEFDLRRESHRTLHLILNAHKLSYGGIDIRLLVSIADTTDARIAQKTNEDLLRDRAILLQELQHRVANSLQIIASVLLQSARRVQSEEAKTHLRDAHNRVMSVAAIQKLLAISTTDQVSLQPYFSQLCDSLGASMIPDPELMKLEVRSDESRVDAAVSVRLGLVVTELVINALKHAFPEKRGGKISIDYASAGSAWTLSVSDNGIGMLAEPGPAKAGLGTSIIQALAQQMEAQIDISDAMPGTKVSLRYPIAGGPPAVAAI